MLKFDSCIIRNHRSHAWVGLRRKCLLDRKGLHSGALSSKTLWELSKDHLLLAVRTADILPKISKSILHAWYIAWIKKLAKQCRNWPVN